MFFFSLYVQHEFLELYIAFILHGTCCKILGDLKQITYKRFMLNIVDEPLINIPKIRQFSHYWKLVKIQDGRRKIMKTTNNGQFINISNIFKEQNLFKMKIYTYVPILKRRRSKLAEYCPLELLCKNRPYMILFLSDLRYVKDREFFSVFIRGSSTRSLLTKLQPDSSLPPTFSASKFHSYRVFLQFRDWKKENNFDKTRKVGMELWIRGICSNLHGYSTSASRTYENNSL